MLTRVQNTILFQMVFELLIDAHAPCMHASTRTHPQKHMIDTQVEVCAFLEAMSAKSQLNNAPVAHSTTCPDQWQKKHDQRSMVYGDGALMIQGKNSEGVKDIEPWHSPLTSSAEAPLRTHSASHWPSGRSLPCVLFDYKPLKFGCFSMII